MRDLAKDKYERTAVDGEGIITPPEPRQEALLAFQAVVEVAHVMESDGLIVILELHRESGSGKRYVDAIRFRRLE